MHLEGLHYGNNTWYCDPKKGETMLDFFTGLFLGTIIGAVLTIAAIWYRIIKVECGEHEV